MTPFETARLICDGPSCDAEIVTSASVQHPRDDDARQRARREAERKAMIEAERDGWSVAKHGAKTGDWCPNCTGRRAA